jgi:hypothetical protein
MKQYAVIHAVGGLFEGYSDTTCEFFPDKEAAIKHINQYLDDYRKDEMCVKIEHQDGGDAEVTMTSDYEYYHACVPSDMDHDDYVAEYGDDCSVEVFRLIEIDCERYENASSTEHMWLTWDQQDTCQAWDYYPLCMSLVSRVASDVQDNTGEYRDAYFSDHVFIDIDDYTMHAFRIPKPQSVK